MFNFPPFRQSLKSTNVQFFFLSSHADDRIQSRRRHFQSGSHLNKNAIDAELDSFVAATICTMPVYARTTEAHDRYNPAGRGWLEMKPNRSPHVADLL